MALINRFSMKIILLYILLTFSFHLKAQIGPRPNLQGAIPDETFLHEGSYWVTYSKDSLIESKGKKMSRHWKRQGKWMFFYASGKVKEVGKYKNGISVGKWKFYNENGELVKKEVY